MVEQNWITAGMCDKTNNVNAIIKSAKGKITKPVQKLFLLLQYKTHNELENHKIGKISKILYSKL